MKRKLLIGILVLFLGIITFSFSERYFNLTKELDIFSTLFKEVNQLYVDDTNPGEMMKNALDEMLAQLDPYTNYIPESEIEDYRFMTTGQYGGVGSLVRKKGDYVVITEPYEGFPAQTSGLQAGDLILEIDGKNVKNKTTDEVSKVLRGQPGTEVKVMVQRPGSQDPLNFSITRKEIKVKSVPYYGLVSDSIGYIVLTSFTEECSKEVKSAFVELKEKYQIKGLILDLRNNPGGLLNESVNISNLFLEKGQEIVSTKGRVQEWQKSYKGLNQPIDTEIPLVVLVNKGSASASEIVSGSLQDLDRAVVLGQKTFGKGLVQTTRNLSYNSKLKVTTAKYYIPSGRCIQALDYSNRDENGKVKKVADSLMTVFKTKKGRAVKDGGGIIPDLITQETKGSKILQTLDRNLLIFDFVTDYCIRNGKPANTDKVQLTEKDWLDFMAFIKDKDYDYVTQEEKQITELKTALKEEKMEDEVKQEIKQIEMVFSKSHIQAIEKNKEEIMNAIELELITRYQYQSGKIKLALQKDKEVKEAISLLRNTRKMKEILDGKL
jgi:carboxyl-terminal processing protease